MSDINLSYSFSSSGGASHAASQLWSFNGAQIAPCSPHVYAVRGKAGDKAMLLQAEVVQALQYCREFRPISEHLRRVCDQMPVLKNNEQDTFQMLENLALNGVMESSEQVWRRLTKNNTSQQVASCVLCILTCDRPKALERILAHLKNTGLSDDIAAIYVIDDSRGAGSQKLNQTLVGNVGDALAGTLHYFGIEAQRQCLESLKNELPAASTSIDWLLSRDSWPSAPTYGVARNFALLMSVGQRLIMLDDDIIPQTIAPPLAQQNIRFANANDKEARLWPNKSDMEASTLLLSEDSVTEMLTSLGDSLGSVLLRSNADTNCLHGVLGDDIAPLHSESPLIIDQCGYWGDPGTGNSTQWLLHMPVSTIKRILESSQDINQLLSARAAWVGHRGPALTRYGVMSAQTGVDHTRLLPPYLPAGRGEDIMFGIMTQRLYPDSLVFNEGWAVKHEPVDTRAETLSLAPAGVELGVLNLVELLGEETSRSHSSSPVQRLIDLAEQITHLAGADAHAIEALAAEQLLKQRASLLSTCMQHLTELDRLDGLPGKPLWESFLERSRDGLVSEIQNGGPLPLEGWSSRAGNPDTAKLRSLGKAFGQALRVWPDICAASQKPHRNA